MKIKLNDTIRISQDPEPFREVIIKSIKFIYLFKNDIPVYVFNKACNGRRIINVVKATEIFG